MKHVNTKDQIIQFLEQKLEPNRFDHVISVRDTAVALAEKYGVERQKVELSALLHDCAKWMKNDQLIKICQRNQIEVDFIESRVPSLLHAKVGALLAQIQFNVVDSSILQAIESHTTGMPSMSELDQILFVSDFCEPLRNYPTASKIRKIANTSLKKATFEVCRQKLKSQIRGQRIIHPRTVEVFNQFLIEI